MKSFEYLIRSETTFDALRIADNNTHKKNNTRELHITEREYEIELDTYKIQ